MSDSQSSIVLILMLAVPLGVLLGVWFGRRSARPTPLATATTDLAALDERISRAEVVIVGAVKTTLAKRPLRQDVDLTFLEDAIKELTSRVASLPGPKDVDLGPTTRKVDALLEAVSQPSQTQLDLKSVMERLEVIETQLADLNAPDSIDLAIEPELFEEAEHGDADDLKKISGVGKKLEGVLNQLGVWYFWQIASWSKENVHYVDQRLGTFKGRTTRDNWIPQATSLAKKSDRKPPQAATSQLGSQKQS